MGWVYNLHTTDPHSDIPRVIAICLVFPIAAFLAVCLRFYVRLRTKRPPWWDDYAALIASLLTIAYGGIAVDQTRWGQGLSKDYFPLENVIPFSKIQYIGGPIYCLELLFFKLAFLISYLRIGGFVATYRIVLFVAITVIVVNQVVCAFIISLSCMPVAKQWNTALDGSCIETVSFYYAIAGTNIVFDLIIIILPLPVLWKLQLRFRQKAVLTCMVCLGFFITAIQIIRIKTIKNLVAYTDSKDIVLWSVVEVSLGVIISCVPHYGPLLKSFASNLTSSRGRKSKGSYPLGSRSNHHLSMKPQGPQKTDSSRTVYGSEELGRTTTVIGQKNPRVMADTASEEYILRRSDDGHIHKTTEVVVERS